jgi:hypothetical protein
MRCKKYVKQSKKSDLQRTLWNVKKATIKNSTTACGSKIVSVIYHAQLTGEVLN